MKYKVGDKVRVREDLIVDQWYGNNKFCSGMYSFEGQTVTIKIVKENKYLIEEDSGKWNWTDEMFLPATKYNVGDKVLVRENLISGERYGNDVFTSTMVSFKGKVVTINKVIGLKYEIEEDGKTWNWTDEMFSGKVFEDFSSEESISQSIIPKEESSSNIITVKTNKVKLLLL